MQVIYLGYLAVVDHPWNEAFGIASGFFALFALLLKVIFADLAGDRLPLPAAERQRGLGASAFALA